MVQFILFSILLDISHVRQLGGCLLCGWLEGIGVRTSGEVVDAASQKQVQSDGVTQDNTLH